MGYLKTLDEAKTLLAERAPFTTGTLSARYGDNGNYLVYSYNALIAWSGDTTSLIYDNAYNHSKTTSKHANIVAKAWGLN